MESRSVEVDGVPMRWQEHGSDADADNGSGQPVVLVHGLPTSPRLWRHVVPRIEGARVLTWELVGYGSSIQEGGRLNISVAKQADYLAAWIRKLELGRVVLVGHDLGGGVVQIVAVRHPELVKGIVLTNCIAYDNWPIPSVKFLKLVGALADRVPRVVAWFAVTTLMLRGHDNLARAWESLREHWPYYAQPGGGKALIRQVRSLDVRDTLDISAQLPNVAVPVRIVWGAADEFLKVGYGYRLAYELRGTLDRIEGGKHFVPEDHPDRVAETINSLLREGE